jgi:hypothetical protein
VGPSHIIIDSAHKIAQGRRKESDFGRKRILRRGYYVRMLVLCLLGTLMLETSGDVSVAEKCNIVSQIATLATQTASPFIISPASANKVRLAENALNDSSNVKNISLSGTEDQTFWVNLPKQSNIVNAGMDLKGYEGNGKPKLILAGLPWWSYDSQYSNIEKMFDNDPNTAGTFCPTTDNNFSQGLMLDLGRVRNLQMNVSYMASHNNIARGYTSYAAIWNSSDGSKWTLLNWTENRENFGHGPLLNLTFSFERIRYVRITGWGSEAITWDEPIIRYNVVEVFNIGFNDTVALPSNVFLEVGNPSCEKDIAQENSNDIVKCSPDAGGYWIGQTFRPNKPVLEKISVKIQDPTNWPVGSPRAVLELREMNTGLPGDLLFQTKIMGPTSLDWVNTTCHCLFNVSKTYAIIIKSFGNADGHSVEASVDDKNPYAFPALRYVSEKWETTGDFRLTFVLYSHDADWFNVTQFDSKSDLNLNTVNMNGYLSDSNPDSDGLCSVPFTLHSDTAGRIQISDIDVAYDYNTSYLYSMTSISSGNGYRISHTDHICSVDVTYSGFYVDANANVAEVDGVEYPIMVWNGSKYVDFHEKITKGSYWSDHIVTWTIMGAHPIVYYPGLFLILCSCSVLFLFLLICSGKKLQRLKNATASTERALTGSSRRGQGLHRVHDGTHDQQLPRHRNEGH